MTCIEFELIYLIVNCGYEYKVYFSFGKLSVSTFNFTAI